MKFERSIRPPFLVTGYPRSGTSLICGCLANSGVWTGRVRKPDQFNPKGYFENHEIYRAVANARNGNDLYRKIGHVMDSQGYDFNKPWLFKAFELVIEKADLWKKAWPGTIFIITKRKIEDVLESNLASNSARFGESSRYAKKEYWQGVFAEMDPKIEKLARGHRAYVIESSGSRDKTWKAIKGPAAIGYVRVKKKTVEEFIDPSLWGDWKRHLEPDPQDGNAH